MLVLLLTGMLLMNQPSDSLDLEYCYDRIEQYYPAADKIRLQQKITELNRKIARTGYYPDITASGMASYQSDVTEVTFGPPGGDVPTFSKDHYKFSVDIQQPIYNGGMTGIRRELESAKGEREVHTVEVQLHQVREQVNQVYFATLLLQQRSRSVMLLMESLKEQLRSVRAKVANGVLLPSQASVLRAELVRAEQDSIRLRSERRGALDALGILIGTELGDGTRLEIPAQASLPGWSGEHRSGRPEYRLFSSSRDLLENRKSLSDAQMIPAISAFSTAAYGRPGLNAFEDDLQAYYIVGVRLRWNFWESVNAVREKNVLSYQQQQVTADEQAFTRQLRSALSRLRVQIEALDDVIKKDEEIIRLSREVVEESSSQLNQGVITATEYVLELNRLHQAQLSRKIHEVELAQARTEYLTTLGGPIE